MTNLGTTLNYWLWVLDHLVIVSPVAKQHEGWLLATNSLRRSPILPHTVPGFEYEIFFPCSLTEEGVGYLQFTLTIRAWSFGVQLYFCRGACPNYTAYLEQALDFVAYPQVFQGHENQSSRPSIGASVLRAKAGCNAPLTSEGPVVTSFMA